MNNLTNFFKDIGRWYQYPPRLALCLGGANKAIFVMNLLSRLEQTEDERGVYKTAEEIEDETGLSKYEQEGVRKGLKKLGILRETYARLDHRMYYKIDESTLNTLWEQFSRNRKNLFRETGKTCFDETGKTDFGKGKKPASLYNRSLTADHQENTSNSQSDDCGWNSSDEDENAQESTPPKPPPKPKKNPPCSPPLPDGVDPKVWAAFKEMRQKKRAYVTNHAAELIFRKLEKFKADGNDPNDVLNQSIEGSWTGVYPVVTDRPPRVRGKPEKEVQYGPSEEMEREVARLKAMNSR